MTLLMLDVGNTNLKWCYRSADATLYGVVNSEDPLSLVSELPELAPGTQVWCASVKNKGYDQSLRASISESLPVSVSFVRVEKQFLNVECAYEDVGRLGVDRWLGLLAVADGRPAAVVSLGSAITFDVLDAEGRQLGGYIVPGFKALGPMLNETTQSVNAGGSARASTALGVSTNTAVSNGVLVMVIGFIAQALTLAEQSLGVAPRLIVTGGGFSVLEPLMPLKYQYRPNLVFEGMARYIESKGHC